MLYRRLVVRNCALNAALIFPAVTGVAFLLFLSRLLADAAAAAMPPALVGELLLLTIVKYAPQILILCVFGGCLLALRRAFLRREMDAWFCAGLGLQNFARPVLLFALPCALFVGVFALWGSPWAVWQMQRATTTAALNIGLDTLPRGRFVDIAGGDYAYFWDGNGDVFIARNPVVGGGGAHEIIFARNLEGDGGSLLELQDGVMHRLSPTGIAETVGFDRVRLSLPPAPEARARARALPPNRLRAHIAEERAELAWRLSLPLAAVALALLALLLAPPPRHVGGRHDFLSAIFIFFLYLSFLRYMKTLIAADALPAAVAVALPPLATAALTFFVLRAARR